MNLRNRFLMILLGLTLNVAAQKPIANKQVVPNLAKTSCDCKTAIPIAIGQTTVYGFTQAPNGFGNVQEIKAKNSSDKLAFEQEHNTAWYLLNIGLDGNFIFEIEPQDSTNDYDFLLYKYTDSAFCEELLNKKATPVRSNISRNDLKLKGLTGLSAKGVNEYTTPGPNASFSKPIEVKKGEKYMLVLDNVYPNGKGHKIHFNFIKKVNISGTVLNEDNAPIVADVTLSDNKGNIIEESKSNEKGVYKINTFLTEGVNYNLTFENDWSFVKTTVINTNKIEKSNSAINIKTILPKLKKGEKYKLDNINFYGNVAIPTPESYPSINALYRLMKKNKNMVIQIEGHVNDPDSSADVQYGKGFDQILSDNRAAYIYGYLISKGIEKNRMTTIGLSNFKMLYPHPKTDAESEANRRVEINVISIE